MSSSLYDFPVDTPADLLTALVARAPSTPFLTWYDDAAGERVELSGTTFANWVAKTANLLQEEFDVAPDSDVAVALPVHWQTAAVLLGIWSCGATVVETAPEDAGRLGEVDLALVSQDRLGALEDERSEDDVPLLALSLHPLGLGMTGYAGTARDFAVEVRTAGDVFVPWQRPDPQRPGLRAGGLELTLAGLVATARELAGRLGLHTGDRVLVDAATAAETGAVGWLLAPLAAGASIVLCRQVTADALERRAATERVTVTLGADVPGIRRAGDGHDQG